MKRLAALLTLALLAVVPACVRAAQPPTAADLSGTWVGSMAHAGEEQPIALTLEPDTTGRVLVKLSIPVVHFDHVPVARDAPTMSGDSLVLGPFRFAYDAAAHTLSGIVPRGLIPLYDVPMRLTRASSFDVPARAPVIATDAKPAWTFDAGSPLWAGPTFAGGVVYVGALDGRVFAVDAKTGAKRWERRTAGAVRARPVVEGGALYVPADDGMLYRLDASTGRVVWSVRIQPPIVRLPFNDPATRYDRFSSEVCVSGDRLYVGTHAGILIALDAGSGKQRWSFPAGDAILAAPALANGVIYAGSFDHNVYAVDAATGRLRWKRDTGGAVVSTPVIAGDRVIVGDRAYDLLGLDAASGDVRWTHYLWMSWIESSAVVRGDVAYVGSAEYAHVLACDVRTGKPVWETDVGGWSWGQPVVTEDRVYACASAQVGYPTGIVGGLVALDRATGKPAWRYAPPAPDAGSWGFPGSPAFGMDRVYASGLDGKVLAFPR